jgi:hypothetical protein
MQVGIVVIVVILIVLIAAAAFFLTFFLKRRQQEPHQEIQPLNGQTISATVINIEAKVVLVNPTVTEFAKRYFIQAEWANAETQRTYSFTSAPLPEVPEHIRVGGSVKIRLDPQDPYEYIVVLAP